ncbi:tyrosine-type recombinase/integrase [Nocardia brasiliensis]|uniref:tyrosine-type recombinase/integrase n=1 Tax=Nocardia brasiliensis TaxID=37326 RepID=UPI002457BF29|nr:tyrosine-type recombinase/integrase [Nocardia brasiliensis]
MAELPTIPDVYTARVRRQFDIRPAEGFSTRFVTDVNAAPAPAPADPPRPFGEVDSAPFDDVVAAFRQGWPAASKSNRHHNLRGIKSVLDHLLGFPGETWSQRWASAGLNERHPRLDRALFPDDAVRATEVIGGLRVLFCMRAIQPSLLGFRNYQFGQYAASFRAAARDGQLDRYFNEVEARADVPHRHRIHALFDVCCALTTQGIGLADLTPSALLHHGCESRRHGLVVGASRDKNRFSGLLAWQVLHGMGHFPPSTPPTMRAYVSGGQRSIEELVDRYGIRNEDMRQLLIAYLTRRQADANYSTVSNLARFLAGFFWSAIESINPEQMTLHLDQATYEQWREAINWLTPRKEGDPPKRRKDPHGILMTVRGLYADIHSWAVEDPATWAKWAAPCPIPYGELRGYSRHRRRIKERTDSRTRQRQPLLPVLVEYVETQYEQARSLLAAGAAVEPVLDMARRFTHAGRDYERYVTKHDYLSPEHLAVRIRDSSTGEIVNQTMIEDYCFWRWAAVEVLRLSGIRIEELSELTHLSIRQYKRPNGEVIALLVIAPSKNDRERVIPMSAELFHVIAQVVRRLTAGGQPIPLLHRYDQHTRNWSELMPYLFQRRLGSLRNVVATGTVLDWLKATCAEIAEINPLFKDIHFTPHDFRRLFATDLANSGLPIHIGAALLGHLNLDTFRGYVTVFDEDVVRHYQAHLEKRRQLRPTDEYAKVTEEEWNDFQEHFEKRKVELGSCARPYGTGCQHEHACIRCPMLNINPRMLGRLDEIEKDLLDRRARAEREDWLGEIEGIDLTLSYLRQKQEQTERLTRLAPEGPTMLVLEPPPPKPN